MYEVHDAPTQYVDQQPRSKNYEIYQKESDEVYVQLRPSITNNRQED